ncbi:protein cereblon-like [Melanaphis sacchari]|uniref:protein cereblon-like n=1 Tax=Melanaphis sacchari TaxID=742174 RepID=UPI000DC13BD1|nr:protein cereblon-like [Melanaphis sacchari]
MSVEMREQIRVLVATELYSLVGWSTEVRTSSEENESHPEPISLLRRNVISTELQINTYYNQSPQVLYQYLGNDLHKLAGSINYKSGVVVNTVPLAFMKLNLMPGEIAPIIANSSDIKFILQYANHRNRPFGICHKINENMRTYGVLAMIYDHSLAKESTELDSYELKIRGLQLFEILHVKSFPDNDNQTLALARIKIIPNFIINHPYNELCLRPKKHNLSRSELFRNKNIWQNQWPSWVYKQFDVHELASRIFKKIKILYKDIKFSNIPSVLSFQVTKLGIFTHEEVNELLGIESTNLRLQYGLQYFNKNQSMQKLKCTGLNCDIPITNMSYVLPISPEGLEDSYFGSWGEFHAMVTVTDLENGLNVITVKNLSEYFPGYNSAIIFCPNCTGYLGWSFSIDDNSSSLPKSFYGLAIQAITSINEYILPLASSYDVTPLEENSDAEIIFDAINDTDILMPHASIQ